MRRATDYIQDKLLTVLISIHALREESDTVGHFLSYIISISIHALREESDKLQLKAIRLSCIFQSTLSVRRATIVFYLGGIKMTISIHALREESDQMFQYPTRILTISIHALREESD